jgi:tetratricopeptide (TPR) repeat protein
VSSRRLWHKAAIRLAFPSVFALASLTACHREPPRPAVERIAILRFENLGADVSADWMGRAFSEILAAELEGVPGVSVIASTRLHALDAQLGRRPAATPGISAERTSALAAGASRIVYGQYVVRDGRLQTSMTIEDLPGGRMTSLPPASAPVAGLVQAASALALEISPRITPYGTGNRAVVETHIKALESPDLAGSEQDLQRAVEADPNFGPLYRQLAQIKVQQKDTAGALALLQRALARDTIGGAERARVQLQAAMLRNDAAARQQALADLAKADPSNASAWRDLAASAMARHQYPQAVDAYRKAVDIEPGDPDAWNQLGYAAALTGDTAGASDALLRYQKLLPASPNPLDSLGDVNLIAGRLPEAESYYLQAAKTDPNFLAGLDFLKASMAHLMTGDVAGADHLAEQYFAARAAAKDPMVDYRKAQWSWIGGRRKAACQQMEKLARDSESGPSREVAAHAFTELSLWNLMLGNRDVAAQAAQKAVALATAASAVPALLARFLSQPPAAAAEWEARADRFAPDPSQAPIRNLAAALALLLAKDYAAAAPLLQQMYASASPATDEGLPVLLAWTNLETGHVADAAALLRFNPPLSDVGLSWSTPLYFPRIFYLRAVAAEKQGKADEARRNYQLFRQLSGPDALQWGEEKKAE